MVMRHQWDQCLVWGEEAGGGAGDIGPKSDLVYPIGIPRASVALRFVWNWVEMTGPWVLDVGQPRKGRDLQGGYFCR